MPEKCSEALSPEERQTSQHTSHLYGNTFEKILEVGVSGQAPELWHALSLWCLGSFLFSFFSASPCDFLSAFVICRDRSVILGSSGCNRQRPNASLQRCPRAQAAYTDSAGASAQGSGEMTKVASCCTQSNWLQIIQAGNCQIPSKVSSAPLFPARVLSKPGLPAQARRATSKAPQP